MAEVENEYRGMIPFKCTRKGIIFGIWWKRDGTTPLGLSVGSFRSVSILGGKHMRNGSEVLCPDSGPATMHGSSFSV